MTHYRIFFRRKGGAAWDERPSIVVKGEAERDRILSRKTPIAVAVEKAKLHKCSTCGRRGLWEKGWCWKGGWRSLDEGKPIAIACSEGCRPDAEPSWKWSCYEPLKGADRDARYKIGMTESDQQRLIRERRSVPLPEGWKGAGWCRWCLGYIDGRYRKNMNWHRDCKQAWLLHSDRDVQTQFLIDRDGLECWDCKGGWSWVREGETVLRWVWQGVPWCFPVKPSFNDRDRLAMAGQAIEGVTVGAFYSLHRRPNAGTLEVDHDVPLWSVWHLETWERARYYGPTNLRLRCTACHKAKSKREAAERARLRA